MPCDPFLVPSLVQFRSQIDAFYPQRDKSSDGWIGDARHAAEQSDHNPLPNGEVCAIDITNDPVHECNCAVIAEAIRTSKDARVKYIIFNHFMLRSYDKPGIPAWTWAPYTGPLPHDHHMHVSVVADSAGDAWALPPSVGIFGRQT